MHETLEDADAEAHQRQKHKHQQQRIGRNLVTNLNRPFNGSSEDLADIAHQGSDGNSSSFLKTSLLPQRITLNALQMKTKQIRPTI